MNTNTISAGVLAGVFALAIGVNALYQHGTKEDVTFTVTDKERVTESSTDSEGNSTTTSHYRIYTESPDGEINVYKNTDAWLSGKFASSNLHGYLREGCDYDATTYGWRIPLISMYPNIVSATSHGSEDCPAPQAQ